jgi:hypothetical protein
MDSNTQKNIQVQISWLKKLASGTLGFNNLSVLRIVYNDKPTSLGSDMITEWILREVETTAPLYFTTKKLEIVVGGYSCPGADCSVDETIRSMHSELSKMIIAQPQT